jgi:hypothetical protein
MIQRSILPQVQQALDYFPVVGIIGPRQVGKTTLAKILEKGLNKPTLFLDLERDSDRQKLAEPELFLQQYTDRCIIIDEIQNIPTLLPLIRWLVDQDRRPARFILTGSASPDIIKGSTETLAGRIAYFELMPFSLLEIGDIKSQTEHWFRGGFPDSLLAPNAALSEMWLGNFIETFLQRDIRRIGYDITVPSMERLLKVVASTSGSLLNIDGLSNSLGISAITVKKYLDILEGSFLLRRLQPFYVNTTKRLVRSPKIFIRDTGLLHRLMGIRDFEQLHGSMWLGNSWETYVIEEIARAGGKAFEYSFYRTQSGTEVDLVLRGASRKLTMIEIKYSVNASPSKGFHSVAEDLKPDFKYIIVPEGDMWERASSVFVCGLRWFLTHEMSKL